MRKKIIILAGILVLFLGAVFIFNRSASPLTKKTEIAATLRVTQTVTIKDKKDKTVLTFKNGETALQLLGKTHKVTAKGQNESAFVTAIDGITADSTSEFWSFYVNGKQAQVGAGSYALKNNDTIEWKIEAFK